MRIVHIASHTGVYRGGAVQIIRMARALQARGHDVHVIVNVNEKESQREKDRDWESWEPLRESGIPTRAIAFESVPGRIALRKDIGRVRPHIVHAHRNEALVATWLAMWGMRRPSLVAQRGTISQLPTWPLRAFRSKRVPAVVAVARAVRRSLIKQGVSSGKIHVVYGSVDLDQFSPHAPAAGLREDFKIPADAYVVGSLSAYRRKKGLEDLLKALARLMPDMPRLFGLFIGAKVEARLQPVAEDLGIADRCLFMGHQSNVFDWLSIMNLTVVPAWGREGLSGVLRESLAMEVPVISTDCAGNDEIVRDRETGLLVPQRDPEALARAISWAVSHPIDMKAMARHGHDWVRRYCSLGAQAEAIERVYEKVL